jgi:hypothetical protein
MSQCQCLNASGANKGKRCINKSKPGSKWCGKHKNCKTIAAKTKADAKAEPAAKTKTVKPYGTYGGAPTARVLLETYKKYHTYATEAEALEAAVQADYTGWWDEECRVLASRNDLHGPEGNGVPVLRRSPKTKKECDAHWNVTDYIPLTDQQLLERGLLTQAQMREMQGALVDALQ